MNNIVAVAKAVLIAGLLFWAAVIIFVGGFVLALYAFMEMS